MSAGNTFFPDSIDRSFAKAEEVAAAALGERLPETNPVRQALALYTHSAGIETGYGYFAPNVPNNHKLVFEIHYRDGSVEYALPNVGGSSTGLRLTNLFDNIRQMQQPAVRELMVRMLAYSIWRKHPEAMTIRAVFGIVNLPTLDAFRHGRKETYEALYAYDFSFVPPAPPP